MRYSQATRGLNADVCLVDLDSSSAILGTVPPCVMGNSLAQLDIQPSLQMKPSTMQSTGASCSTETASPYAFSVEAFPIGLQT